MKPDSSCIWLSQTPSYYIHSHFSYSSKEMGRTKLGLAAWAKGQAVN